MKCFFRACAPAPIPRTDDSFVFVNKSSWGRFSVPRWKISFEHAGIATVNSKPVQYCSSSSGEGGSKSCLYNICTEEAVVEVEEEEEEEEEFFVVRKGDLVGVYRSLSECQAQVGPSICDPPVSVYKGYALPKDTEEYLLACGLKNAHYAIRTADLKEDLFGSIVPCPFQQPSSSEDESETPSWDMPEGRPKGMLETDIVEAVESTLISNNSLKQVEYSCIVEFDGASKGNPGLAGAGAVLRTDDGSLICRLREGLGIATNNVAEYRALILGMKYALKKGFKNVRVSGDSKLVFMQIQGLWKVRNHNLLELYVEAKKLKDKFVSFEISHILRDLNSDADAQANFAARLAYGEIQEIE